MLNDLTRQSEEPLSALAVKLHKELIREGEDALTARYAEALVVIEYMWSQYTMADDADRLDLAEDFAPEDALPELFKEALNNPIEKNPPHYDGFYGRCDDLYKHLRPIADSIDEPVGEKKKGIVQLSRTLHSNCAKAGGNIYRIIISEDKHREQD